MSVSSSTASAASDAQRATSHAHAGPIRCVMYCEFDNRDGPRMYHQYPPNSVPVDQFDAIAKYIITDEVSGVIAGGKRTEQQQDSLRRRSTHD